MNNKYKNMILFMETISKEYGEAVNLNDADCSLYCHELENSLSTSMSNQFFIVVNLKKSSITWEYSVKKYLDIFGSVSLPSLFDTLLPEYFDEYLKWAGAAYTLAAREDTRAVLEPLKQSYKITLPMRLKTPGNKYFWIQQQSRAIQLDKDKNLISHLNIYTVLEEYQNQSDRKIKGDAWDQYSQREDWKRELAYLRYKDKHFHFTQREFDILQYIKKNANHTNTQIACSLGISVNTLNEHNKNIIKKINDCIPALNIGSVREFISALQNFDWFKLEQPH